MIMEEWERKNDGKVAMCTIFVAADLFNVPPGLTLNNCTKSSHCIHVYCVDLRTAAFALYNTNRLVFKTDVEYSLRGTHKVLTYKLRLKKNSADSFLTNLIHQMPQLTHGFVCSTYISI